MLDRSLSIVWYDLPSSARTSYLPWLHGSYIPKLLKKPGIMWAAHYAVHKYEIPSRMRHTQDPSVPTGNDYMLLLGARSSHDFSRSAEAYVKAGAPGEDAEMTADDRKMLALRTNQRTSIMTEEARVDGPDIKLRPQGTAPSTWRG